MDQADMGETGIISRHGYYSGGIRLRHSEYTLYVDESGNGGKEKYFVAAGILLHEDMVDGAWGKCRAVAEEHSEGQVGELKFTHMMNGKKGFPKANGCRRGPARGILDIVEDEQMPFFATIVHKETFGDERFPGYRNVDHYATERVMIAALDYAGMNRSKVDVIRDKGNGKRDDGITETFGYDRKDGTHIDGTHMDGGGHRIESIGSFGTYRPRESKEYNGLQLADFCASAVARVMNRGRSDCYGRIRALLDTPLNTGAVPGFYPGEPGGPGRIFRERTDMCICASRWHALLRILGRSDR